MEKEEKARNHLWCWNLSFASKMLETADRGIESRQHHAEVDPFSGVEGCQQLGSDVLKGIAG